MNKTYMKQTLEEYLSEHCTSDCGRTVDCPHEEEWEAMSDNNGRLCDGHCAKGECVCPQPKPTWQGKEPSEAQKKYWDSLRGLKNEKAPGWKNVPIKIESVHKWLDANFGKPSICENPNCLGKSKFYDWAKKTDAEYIKDRNSFYRLCRSCHWVYDSTPEKREQSSKNLWWATGTSNPCKLGGTSTLKKYGKEKMKEWGKLGGRPKNPPLKI